MSADAQGLIDLIHGNLTQEERSRLVIVCLDKPLSRGMDFENAWKIVGGQLKSIPRKDTTATDVFCLVSPETLRKETGDGVPFLITLAGQQELMRRDPLPPEVAGEIWLFSNTNGKIAVASKNRVIK